MASIQKNNSTFWISYTDLMTSLFFIMLILYVLTFVKLKKEQEKDTADAKKLRKIEEIEESTKTLAGKNFIFQEEFKRYQLKKTIHFPVNSDVIPKDDYDDLIDAGKEIERIIENAHNYKDLKIKYLVLVEGMASIDRISENYGFQISYLRALSVYKFWEKSGIKFDPDICEVQITGSGWRGVGRDSQKEENNRRILIQIIPKVSK